MQTVKTKKADLILQLIRPTFYYPITILIIIY